MDKFEKIKVGTTAELIHQVTDEDVLKFVELTGDNNPLHVDDKYATQTSFKKKVVHGMLVSSFISTLIGTKLPGTGSLWLSQTLEFLIPVRIGDCLKIQATVKHKSITQRIVIIGIDIFNQNGQKIQTGEAKVKILGETPLVNLIENKPVNKVKSKLVNIKMRSRTKGAAIVTGSSRGIGAAIAFKLAQDGFGVIVNYRSRKEEAASVLKGILDIKGEGLICQGDVRNYADAQKMAELACDKFGSIDVLVNNASSKILSHSLEELSWEDIQEHLDVQLKGSFNMCKAVIPSMLEQKKGKIINIGSIVSDNVPPLKWYSYSIAKSALATFSRSLAAEFGPKGININCVSPGMTETMLIADIPEKVKMVAEMQTPLRRIAKPEDIASVISFLASDAAAYLTGETIRVCGGQMMI